MDDCSAGLTIDITSLSAEKNFVAEIIEFLSQRKSNIELIFSHIHDNARTTFGWELKSIMKCQWTSPGAKRQTGREKQ